MEPSIFFDEVNERQGAFHRRTFLLGGFAGAGLLALTGRLMELQLVEANRYQLLSASNQFNFRLRPPPRGRILDRNGVEIASNRPSFRLMVARDELHNVDSTLDSVGQLLPISAERRVQLKREISTTPRSVPVIVANDLTWDEFARINVRTPELPGVTADMGEARFYPHGGAFAHVIGYVAKISKAELDKAGPNPEPFLLHPGFRIGKQGVEKSLDTELRGVPGAQKVEVDSVGRVIREDPAGDIKAVPGKDVVLTLDADVQNRALEVFGEESGGAVMMNIHTGDILCLVSAPSFDVNRFATGVSTAEYRALASYERKPLLNKALYGTYPPGSTFKTLVALAALEAGINPNATHFCGGTWPWGGRVWHCDKKDGHGTVNLHDAIVTSCDIYFYQTSLAIGPDKIAEVARKFGLGQIFDIGIPGQRKGLVPDREYKRRAFKKDPVWHPGETPSMGIGQGYTNLNALQLCVQVARIANGRQALLPRLIQSVGGVERPSGADVPELDVDKEHLAFVRKAMADVVLSGTAARTGDLNLGPIKMAGKTGTAQAYSYGGGRGAYGAVGEWKLRDHAWFIAFAPYDDPKYAISVLVEHGGFGAQAAAPRAREIMRVALLKDPEIRKRIEVPLPDRPLAPYPEDGGVPEQPTPITPELQPSQPA